MEEIQNTGELANYFMAFFGAIVAASIESVKKIIAALTGKLLKKLNKSNMDVTKHGLYNAIDGHLGKIEYKTYSESPFKQAVIVDRERIFWTYVRDTFQSLDVTKSKELFNKELFDALDKINNYTELLVKEGMPEKVIKIMEHPCKMQKTFLNSSAKILVQDNIYDTNSEKLWVIQSLYLNYIHTGHEEIIEAMSKANGSLKGESYKGIIEK